MVMMADLMRWNPIDELQKFTDTFDRLLNRWRSSSARNESRTYGSISDVDDGFASPSLFRASRPRTSRWTSRAEASMFVRSSVTATPK